MRKVSDRIRAHEVGGACVYLKGKVLVVAAHLDRDGVDARAKIRHYDAREKGTKGIV
jgi:hypothetical protein